MRNVTRWMGRARGWIALTTAACAMAGVAATAAPVEFAFRPKATAAPVDDPWAREIWAEVVTPAKRTLWLPAYYAGDGVFAVRARAETVGEYRLGAVTETSAEGAPVAVACEERVGGAAARVVTEAEVERRRQVKIAGRPAKFALADGTPFAPLGANLAWAEDADRVAWYAKALREFEGAGLNWTRVWMAHWGGLNLDWLADDAGPSPRPGRLDEDVAKRWDAILGEAEARGVYVQVVLQHHGQYSSTVNSNWAQNPWNAANAGGFLRTPGEFFTSAEARRLTKRKYRAIVARWGWSPAVMAWELFNEVHWVDALRVDHNESAVAAWHDEMAAYLRSLDVYGHLVTTSTETLGSPVYRTMDYFQPHLYGINMLAAARRLDELPAGVDRPVFYGEQGDDNIRFTPEQRDSGVEIAPVAWASLMGSGRYAAQPWEGGQMLARGRVGEMAALARFLWATRLSERDGLEAFSPLVVGAATEPLVLEPGERWHRRVLPEFAVPTDGRQAPGFATLPGILVGRPKSVADGYPERLVFRAKFPTAATATLRVSEVGKDGAAVRVEVDGELAVEKSLAAGATAVEVAFSVAAGEHALAIGNVGKADWFQLAGIDLGLKVPALAAIGRRGRGFVVVWIWNRSGVLALGEPSAAEGEVLIEDLPSGKWRATWWDGPTGRPQPTVEIEHRGGGLRLTTPATRRHAALVLER